MNDSQRVHDLRELCEDVALRLKETLTYLKALHEDQSLVVRPQQRLLLIHEGDASLRNFELIFTAERINPDGK